MSTNELHNAYGRARLEDRQITELIGICRGLIADGVVNRQEAEFLQKWLVANAGITGNPVICNLLAKVHLFVADRSGHSDEDATCLFEALSRFTGNDIELGEVLKSTTLPLDEPPPELLFEGMRYCFTGTFAFGSRRQCEEAVDRLGGECGSLTLGTDYLVIGIYASESWAQSSYGRKIERAVEIEDRRA